MILPRLWVIVLCCMAALLALGALWAPEEVAQNREAEAKARLERAQHSASLLLRINARLWMDNAAQVATQDRTIAEALDQSSRGSTDLTLLHQTVNDRLKSSFERMKVELLIATDAKGRVIGRAGVDADVYGDGIEGLPLVAEALRGVRGDDTWSLGGRLYRVAASPVVHKDRYVGTVVVGQEVSGELAQSMKVVLKVEVAFVLRGRVVGSTSSAPALQNAVEMIQKQPGRAIMPTLVPGTKSPYLVAVTPLPGQATAHRAACVLFIERPADTLWATTVGQLAHEMSAGLHALTHWPRARVMPIVIAAILLIGLSMLVLWLGIDGPLRQLEREVQRLARGEIPRLSDDRHPGSLGTIARSLNTALARREPIGPPSTTDALLSVIGMSRSSEDRSAKTHDSTQRTAAEPTVEAAADAADAAPEAAVHEPMPPQDTNPSPAATVPDDFAAEETKLAEKRSHPLVTSGPFAHPEHTAKESPNSKEPSDEDEIRVLYEDYLRMKQQCSESIQEYTFEKFAIKLKENRAQIMSRFGCKDVRFSVYIKDGKTALRATPLT